MQQSVKKALIWGLVACALACALVLGTKLVFLLRTGSQVASYYESRSTEYDVIENLGGPRSASGYLEEYIRAHTLICPEKSAALILLLHCEDHGLRRTLRLLSDPAPGLRSITAHGIGLAHFDTPEILDALARAVREDGEWRVRASAARSLGQIGLPARRVLPALSAALADESPGVRENAAWAFSDVSQDPDEVVSELLPLVDDPDKGVVEAAVRGILNLEALGIPADKTLISKAEDTDAKVQRRACFVLGAMGSRAVTAVSALERLAENATSSRVRQAAREALMKIKKAQQGKGKKGEKAKGSTEVEQEE